MRSLYRFDDRFFLSVQVFCQDFSGLIAHRCRSVIYHRADPNSLDQADHFVTLEKVLAMIFLTARLKRREWLAPTGQA